jgi:hypothetical protein
MTKAQLLRRRGRNNLTMMDFVGMLAKFRLITTYP